MPWVDQQQVHPPPPPLISQCVKYWALSIEHHSKQVCKLCHLGFHQIDISPAFICKLCIIIRPLQLQCPPIGKHVEVARRIGIVVCCYLCWFKVIVICVSQCFWVRNWVWICKCIRVCGCNCGFAKVLSNVSFLQQAKHLRCKRWAPGGWRRDERSGCALGAGFGK